MDDRVGFMQWVLGEVEGYIAIGALHAKSGDWEETLFNYPSDLEGVGKFISSHVLTHNLYFCPTVLAEPRRVKANIKRSAVLWSDLDECHPDFLKVKPTVVIESSPGRFQGFWKLDGLIHADDAEKINKRIAYAHKHEGADTSGWDLTQYLRVPGTKNHKYVPELYDVIVRDFDREAIYPVEAFDVYPELREERAEELSIPFPAQLPDWTAEGFLESIKTSVHPRIWTLFEQVPEGDWSKALWQLELMLFDAGAKPEEVFIVALDAACNKYERDHRNDLLLWKDVLRAHDYSKNASMALSAEVEEFNWFIADRNLLTVEERDLADATSCIVDEYMDWATSVGDAAPAYHVAGAFVMLSALISGPVRLPTSFGAKIPNLWFMILADTTLTRKTTAMDMAMDIVVEIDSAALAATDGSVEGLLRTVSQRPRMPSVFLRDEFSGLLESMKKKDYMAGMLETFTKLYDGKYQKKELAKSTVEIKDPILIMFVGGIKQRVFELLTYEHINSGFLPRFCVITAESDPSRVRPLGPPTRGSQDAREAIVEHFRSFYTYYNPPQTAEQLMPPQWDAELTDEAWIRYNQFESDMTDIGVESASPDLMTPMMIRLCESGLKAAILLAATRLGGPVVVTEADLIKAFSYVETWKSHAINVVANAGKTTEEKQLERVYQAILAKGDEGYMRSKLMQLHRLDARSANNVFDTLEQRGLIRKEKGRGIRYYATRRTTIKEKITS